MTRPGDPIWARWAEIDGHLERLLDLDPAEREVELVRRCGGDAELEETLRRLLAAGARASRIESGPSADLVTAALDESAPREPLPERVGPYRTIRRLGRGGMGTVFLAERDDPSFPNRVALKLLRRGVDTEDVLARFRAERQILASLHHPGIATVFDAGTSEDGRPFLVMEHVEGMPLIRHCDANELGVPARLRLFMAVLRAVSYAHEHGVVHRDLKPSNILVTREEAHVKLLDFGIAKLLDRGGDTARGDGAGTLGTPPTGPDTRPMTPGFASPEQVLGLPITEASDIYQLGLLLHELLTGTRPFAGGSSLEYERRIATTEPDLPSRALLTQPWAVPMQGVADGRELARILRGDLDAIVLRCLQRDPAARYATVEALREDIVNYLEGHPVRARRATRRYRAAKLVRRRAKRLALPAVAIAAVAGSWLIFEGVLGGPFAEAGPSDVPDRWIATAGIADATDPAMPNVAPEVGELVASTLGNADRLQVVRLPGEADATATHRAARQAGASEVIGGVVRTLPSGELELVLRRTEASSGQQLDSVQARGEGTFELVDAALPILLSQYDVPASDLDLIRVSTSSPRAYAFYVEGLTAFGIGDNRVAERFFGAALDEDSTFALAAYYASRTAELDRPAVAIERLNRAHRLAAHASDRERLMIRAYWAARMEEPSLMELADSFVVRFPAEPEGHYLQGDALIHAGDFLGAVESLKKAVALDSLSLHAVRGPCVACDALRRMVNAYILADSMTAAIRTGERWTTLQPQSARAWQSLASALINVRRYDAALEAQGRAASLRAGHLTDQLFPGIVALHRGDFEAADRLFQLHLRTATQRVQIQAAHWLAISLRTQGRWVEALETSEELIDLTRSLPPADRLDVLGHLARALALLGSGQPEEAAKIFEASGREFDEVTDSWIGRDRAWTLTHAGVARAAAGDTVALKNSIERVEAAGARSIYGRDQRLHHYLRGLLARHRGTPEREVEEHFRAALYSYSSGYSRINLELGESLLRQGRYEEAAYVAGAALRNSMQSNGMYATRSDFHELLGRILHAAGERDSARVHIMAALDAWRAADPNMRPRVEHLEALLTTPD